MDVPDPEAKVRSVVPMLWDKSRIASAKACGPVDSNETPNNPASDRETQIKRNAI